MGVWQARDGVFSFQQETRVTSIVGVGRGGNRRRVAQFARELGGMMDEHGHALGTDPGRFAVVAKGNEGDLVFGALAVEAPIKGVGHGSLLEPVLKIE